MIITKRFLLAALVMPLVLLSGNGFAADQPSDDLASLQKDEWLVVKVDGTSAAEETNHTIMLAEDGSVSGHTACNTYTAQAVFDGVYVSFTDIKTTTEVCMYLRQASAEQDFVKALGAAASYVLNVNVWRIYDASNDEVLKLRRMGTFMVR